MAAIDMQSDLNQFSYIHLVQGSPENRVKVPWMVNMQRCG
jgi:hypothetical protein